MIWIKEKGFCCNLNNMVMNYEFVIKIILRMCGSLNCDRGLYVSSLFNGIYNQKYIIVRATRNIMYIRICK